MELRADSAPCLTCSFNTAICVSNSCFLRLLAASAKLPWPGGCWEDEADCLFKASSKAWSKTKCKCLVEGAASAFPASVPNSPCSGAGSPSPGTPSVCWGAAAGPAGSGSSASARRSQSWGTLSPPETDTAFLKYCEPFLFLCPSLRKWEQRKSLEETFREEFYQLTHLPYRYRSLIYLTVLIKYITTDSLLPCFRGLDEERSKETLHLFKKKICFFLWSVSHEKKKQQLQLAIISFQSLKHFSSFPFSHVWGWSFLSVWCAPSFIFLMQNTEPNTSFLLFKHHHNPVLGY